jgi:diketogulonate reductase-like aldo/keto reductase
MIENLSIFDFKLDQDDMKKIATLDLKTTQFPEWS